MTRMLSLLLLVACSGSDPMVDYDAGAPEEDAAIDLDAFVMDDATVLDDAGLEDGGTDAFTPEDSGPDVMADTGTMEVCPSGVYHEPTNRCFFLVPSRGDGSNPCPEGSRRARWSDSTDQRLVQSFLGSLESQSPTTSLRRRGYVAGAPWVWDDNTPAPSGLVWASAGHSSLTRAYLTPDGLVPYHEDRRWTLCEGADL